MMQDRDTKLERLLDLRGAALRGRLGSADSITQASLAARARAPVARIGRPLAAAAAVGLLLGGIAFLSILDPVEPAPAPMTAEACNTSEGMLLALLGGSADAPLAGCEEFAPLLVVRDSAYGDCAGEVDTIVALTTSGGQR